MQGVGTQCSPMLAAGARGHIATGSGILTWLLSLPPWCFSFSISSWCSRLRSSTCLRKTWCMASDHTNRGMEEGYTSSTQCVNKYTISSSCSGRACLFLQVLMQQLEVPICVCSALVGAAAYLPHSYDFATYMRTSRDIIPRRSPALYQSHLDARLAGLRPFACTTSTAAAVLH